ncbi:MAG: hypothetical protein Q8916_01455 [Bacteroidota bacterium]|nr:hypothetical protein [Bacteroidota bacterium]
MKKYVAYAFLFFLHSLVVLPGTSYGQANWRPKIFSILIPASGSYHQGSLACPNEVPDTSWNVSDIVDLEYSNVWDSLTKYSRQDNLFTIEYRDLFSQPICDKPDALSFELDSVNGKIRNFFMSMCQADNQTFPSGSI